MVACAHSHRHGHQHVRRHGLTRESAQNPLRAATVMAYTVGNDMANRTGRQKSSTTSSCGEAEMRPTYAAVTPTGVEFFAHHSGTSGHYASLRVSMPRGTAMTETKSPCRTTSLWPPTARRLFRRETLGLSLASRFTSPATSMTGSTGIRIAGSAPMPASRRFMSA